MATTSLARVFALALAPIAACGKTPRSDPSPSATTAPSMLASSSSAMAPLAPPPPTASSAPSPASSANQAARFAENLASARQQIVGWKCSPNQPVQLKPHRAALITFRCPDDTDLVAFDARSHGGFLLIDGISEGYAMGRGTLGTDIEKRADGGLLHRLREGKTDALVVGYAIWHLIGMPTGYRLGAQVSYTSVFAIVDGAWVAEAKVPEHPADGFRFGRDPVPVFPMTVPSATVCFPSTSCNVTTTYPFAERFESWDGERYASDLEELGPLYRARLKAARAFLARRLLAASAAPSASVTAGSSAAPSASVSAASSSAPPAASVMASASSSASAPLPAKTPPADARYDDEGGCPLGAMRAASEVFAYSRLLNDAPEDSAAMADRAAPLLPDGGCDTPKHKVVPQWPKLRDELEKSWKPGTLSRKRQ